MEVLSPCSSRCYPVFSEWTRLQIWEGTPTRKHIEPQTNRKPPTQKSHKRVYSNRKTTDCRLELGWLSHVISGAPPALWVLGGRDQRQQVFHFNLLSPRRLRRWRHAYQSREHGEKKRSALPQKHVTTITPPLACTPPVGLGRGATEEFVRARKGHPTTTGTRVRAVHSRGPGFRRYEVPWSRDGGFYLLLDRLWHEHGVE